MELYIDRFKHYNAEKKETPTLPKAERDSKGRLVKGHVFIGGHGRGGGGLSKKPASRKRQLKALADGREAQKKPEIRAMRRQKRIEKCKPIVTIYKGKLMRFASAGEACEKLGIPYERKTNIYKVCKGKRQHCYGYRWWYESDRHIWEPIFLEENRKHNET